MIIQDEELRTLFKAESDEHLQRLEEGLLRLESSPADSSTLESLFREAHSLKGAAAMLGVAEVETLAHRFEDALGAAKRQETALTPDAIDRMCLALDDIRSLVTLAVSGEIETLAVDQELDLFAAPAAQNKNETIRVEPHKLDALMTETTELMAVKTRIAHRAVQADRMIEVWEEWNRSHKRDHPEDFGKLLYQLRDDILEDGARLEFSSSRLEESVRAIRLLPLSTIFNLFPRLVRDIAREQQKEVRVVIQGERIAADKRLLEEMKDPLMHMIRNAVDHGIETPSEREERGKPRVATIRLAAVQKGSAIVIEVSDDGRGLSAESIKATARKRLIPQDDLDRMSEHEIQSLIFMPGFSTRTAVTGISGRGVGMDVVRSSIEKLKGSILFESVPGSGCTFRLQLPASLATSRVLLVGIGVEFYALPMESIHSTRFITAADVFTLEGRESILVDGRPVSLVPLFDMLELRGPHEAPASRPGQPRVCLVLESGHDLLALIVDELLDEQEVVVRPLGSILKRVRNVSGGAILVTGAVCTVLNPLDLLESARKRTFQTRPRLDDAAETIKRVILLVEDSITTRTWEKRGLEAAGYEVTAAVDGIDALQKLSQRSFDAVVSDVQMPNMDGLTLTARIRESRKNKELPIVLVTSLADAADRQRGIEAGASAYIPKQTFNQQLLVETLERFL